MQTLDGHENVEVGLEQTGGWSALWMMRLSIFVQLMVSEGQGATEAKACKGQSPGEDAAVPSCEIENSPKYDGRDEAGAKPEE